MILNHDARSVNYIGAFLDYQLLNGDMHPGRNGTDYFGRLET